MGYNLFRKKKKDGLSPDQQEYNDLGLSNKASGETRMINKDGNFNVVRKGLSFEKAISPYHTLITMRWLPFIVLIMGIFFFVNLFYTVIYCLLGPEHFAGIIKGNWFVTFYEMYFFSVQTYTTVGYGRVSPITFSSGFIASIESLSGLMSFAIATGLLYGRFSRPFARIIFSKNALIAPYKDINALEFRVANQRSNQLIEVEAQVMLSYEAIENEKPVRKFYELKLERKQINFFPLSWTIVHPIDESSPLKYATKEEAETANVEILIILKGFDDTFAQNVHARYSYRYHELIWGARFTNIMGVTKNGATTIELNRMDEYYETPLNTKFYKEEEEKVEERN